MPAMAHPPLMNQPPQIFGAHAYDGLPMQHLPPELTAQMFGDPNGLLDDANEAKRRRIARVSYARGGDGITPRGMHAILTSLPQACDMCRKKKIKCDGKLPACTHCINYKTECVFTQVEKKRNPPKG